MKKFVIFHAVVFYMLAFLSGCKKDDSQTPEIVNTPIVSINFLIDNNSLLFDTLKYTNAAGNVYSVSRLQFYLSAFEFENQAGDIYKFNDVIYIDAQNDSNKFNNFSSLPLGNYKSLKFLIGLDSLHNLDNALPNTLENLNMTWPSPMGGGYHFMKLEGNFVDTTAQAFGYAMHLGKNVNCVRVNLLNNFSITSESNKINLTMNINEWFKNPQVYDFNVDGNYSMSDSSAMAKLSQNGVDVFKLN